MFRAPSGEGGRQVTSENVRLAAKPQMGRGLGTAETNLVAGFSWQGSHGRVLMAQEGCNFKQLSQFFFVEKGVTIANFFLPCGIVARRL